jgi:sugar phosphate isomerase/epimerase
MYKVAINFDEISNDLKTALEVMNTHAINWGELRMVNGKNFVLWTDTEISTFKRTLEAAGIRLVAAATPLFKWYAHIHDPDVSHDTYGFNPRLSFEEKHRLIKRTIEIAVALSIPRLRIFSCLGTTKNPGLTFAGDPLLGFALELASQHDIDLYIENEPVCRVNSKTHLVELLSHQKNARLKLWLDVANLLELREEIDEVFLAQVADRLGYIHVKDFIMREGQKNYVTVGEGEIDYKKIFLSIDKLKLKDLVFSVETHAKTNKITSSINSFHATKKLTSYLNRGA